MTNGEMSDKELEVRARRLLRKFTKFSEDMPAGRHQGRALSPRQNS